MKKLHEQMLKWKPHGKFFSIWTFFYVKLVKQGYYQVKYKFTNPFIC
jgi:hypothetical protein